MIIDPIIRSRIVSLARQYFLDQQFTEIISPCFVDHPAAEATLTAFKTKNFYLPTSPEFYLKKLISQQKVKNCFSLAHCFRDLEANTPYHLPEFLMLEWYELGVDYLATQQRTIDLLKFIYKSLAKEFPKVSEISLSSLNPLLSEPDFNQKFLNDIEPNINKNNLVFITGYPQHLSYFSKPQTNNPQIAQRFEAYLNGIEIANGNTEDETNPFPIPPCSGCGLGIDRLSIIINYDRK